MAVKTMEEIEEFFKELFPFATISIRNRTYKNKPCINVTIEKEYDYVDLSFAILMRIAKFCGTQQIDIDEWAESGCPTCDLSYIRELQIMDLGSWNGELE